MRQKEHNMTNNAPRTPWTQEQLDGFLSKLETEIVRVEDENPNARPLPPMTVDECKGFFGRLLDIAHARALDAEECLLMGQLLAVFQFAVRAETLGKKGRFFVMSEEDVNNILQQHDSP